MHYHLSLPKSLDSEKAKLHVQWKKEFVTAFDINSKENHIEKKKAEVP